MNFTNLKLYLDHYFIDRFDHETILDSKNNPFVQVSYVKAGERASIESYSFYVTPPKRPAIHDSKTNHNATAAFFLSSQYLLQNPQTTHRLEEPWGVCDGFVTDKGDIILCTVTTNPEDAKWVCKSVLTQLQIWIKNPEFIH